jgi:hypothetical protein
MKKSRTNISYSCVLLFIVITFSSNGRVQKINIKQLKRKKLQRYEKNCRKMYFKFHWKYGNEIVKHFKGKHDSKNLLFNYKSCRYLLQLKFLRIKASELERKSNYLVKLESILKLKNAKLKITRQNYMHTNCHYLQGSIFNLLIAFLHFYQYLRLDLSEENSSS